ncbi:unnamed protein product [Cyclocybe aegerita]|uniref:Hydrophobin n=1 Tax=Cyclocybe aegerita TaxID=1973307 RepID=A0A8S0WIF2_CYCAE|nr:unnamed protein product [Cyclocybe aegerita]
MFTKLATITLAVLAATPALISGLATTNKPSCKANTGDLQCCNAVYDHNSSKGRALLEKYGIILASVTGSVGQTCSPITGVVLSGNSCTQQPVCCTNNTFNGVIAVGCSPVNINA